MKVNIPDEEHIINAICSTNLSIYSTEDILHFLKNNDINKSLMQRFVSWLIILNVIPRNRTQWGPTLHKRVGEYFKEVGTHLSKFKNTPLKHLPIEAEEIITQELNKSLGLFEKMIYDLGGKPIPLDELKFRLQRIIALMCRKDSEWFSYSEGFNLIILNLFAFCCKICQPAKLSLDFAEAYCYILSGRLLLINTFIFPLKDELKIAQFFQNLEDAVRVEGPIQYQLMLNEGTSLLSFGFRWGFLFFSDQHSCSAVLSIWDQIISRMDQCWEIVQALIVAHVLQINQFDGYQSFSETASNFHSWDITVLIQDAIKIFNHKNSVSQEFCGFCCPRLKKYQGYKLKYS